MVCISHLEPSMVGGPRRNTDTVFSWTPSLQSDGSTGIGEAPSSFVFIPTASLQEDLVFPGTGFQFSFARKNVKLATPWRVAWGVRQEGRASCLFSTEFSRRAEEGISGGAFGGRRGGSPADVADRCPGSAGCSWLHSLYFLGCQLRIIQQLVNHGQVVLFTLSKSENKKEQRERRVRCDSYLNFNKPSSAFCK